MTLLTEIGIKKRVKTGKNSKKVLALKKMQCYNVMATLLKCRVKFAQNRPWLQRHICLTGNEQRFKEQSAGCRNDTPRRVYYDAREGRTEESPDGCTTMPEKPGQDRGKENLP